MKKSFIGNFTILAAVLFIFCAVQSRADDSTTWRNTENLDDFIGTWEGSKTVNIPKNNEEGIPESSLQVSIFFEYKKGSDNVNVTMKMDLNRFLTDMSNMPELKWAGLNKDDLWEMLLSIFENTEYIAGGKYFFNYDLSDKADVFFFDNTGGEILLNDTKNRMKLVFYETVSLELGDEGFTEIILSKK